MVDIQYVRSHLIRTSIPMDWINIIIFERLLLRGRDTKLHAIDFIEAMKKAEKRQSLVGENIERVL